MADAVDLLLELAIALIQAEEGFREKAYRRGTSDPWAIGWGHTQGVTPGQICTRDQAEQWLKEDMAPLLLEVTGLPPIEAAAWIDFGYNCGLGALRRVMRGERKLEEYVHQGNIIIPGLVARRRLEAALIRASRGK